MNSWTGGQFSIFRFCLGLAAAGGFAWQAGEGGWALALGLPMMVVAGAFAVGWYDKVAALLLVFACLVGMGEGAAWIGYMPLGLLFLFHMIKAPPAPFGSVAALGRLDPGGNWKMPPDYIPGVAALFGGVAIANLFLWLTHEETFGWGLRRVTVSTVEVLLFVLQATAAFVFARTQSPSGWLVLVGVTAVLGTMVGSYGATLGHGLFLLVLFQPRWIPARGRAGDPDVMFYDGQCGLCHMCVRLILAEDREGAFIFAPLRGELYHQVFSPEQQRRLPDAVLVPLKNGRVLARSAAALYALTRLGGLWRLIAEGVLILPRPLTDLVYKGVARSRHILFKRPKQDCPLVPPRLARRMKG